MKEDREVRKQLSGPEAAPYLNLARKLLGQMKNQMNLGGLKQLKWSKKLENGVIIMVESIFGLDKVAISVPVLVGKKGRKVMKKLKLEEEFIYFSNATLLQRWVAEETSDTMTGQGSYVLLSVYGVSKDGQTVVGSYQTSGGDIKAFYWSDSTGIVDMGATSPAYATDVNEDGTVIVGMQGDYPFIWTEATGIEQLTTTPPTNAYNREVKISDDGTIVVFSETISGGPDTYISYKWTRALGVESFSSFYVRDISGDGSTIVGWDVNPSTFYQRAVKYTTSLSYLAHPANPGSAIASEGEFAMAVNEDGSVVVGGFGFEGPLGIGSVQYPARWTDAGAENLGVPSGVLGFPNVLVVAKGVSPDGDVVVGDTASGGGSPAPLFRWTASGGFEINSTGITPVITVAVTEQTKEVDE